MIKTLDIFRSNEGQRLDFMSGAIDVADLFNNGILPAVNQLSADTGADEDFDPFGAEPQTVEQSRGFMNALAAGFPESRTETPMGFQRQTQGADSAGASTTEPQPVNSAQYLDMVGTPPPVTQQPSLDGFDPAEFTFNREARKDRQGRLRIYNPPSGDGGGSFEVAGITSRYQPREARRLSALIAEGKQEEAEAEAKDFYRKRAEPFVKYTNQPGLQLQLADSVHHRGEGGLRRILQRATGSNSKDYGELIGQLDSDPGALEKFNDARVRYELDEVDRGRDSRKKFRKGLLNRFRDANEAAIAANARR